MEPSLLLFQAFLVAFAFESEEFNEELLLKPLPDRKVLAHFHFETRAPSTSQGRHHHLFPKAISQLVQKFGVKEMELSFTQGRWNHEQWGGFDPLSSMNAKPVGVELWAMFDVPLSQVDNSWKNLTNALSGLFCASINFLESSASYASPSSLLFGPNSNKVRYGSLPREAVCTENLTPWLKLLPCRDKDGLCTLMHRPSIYRAFYHSHRLHLTTLDSSVIVLEQALTAILQPDNVSGEMNIQPSWSLGSLFGKKVVTRCVLAKSSKVYVQLEGQTNSSWKNSEFELSVKPDSVLQETNSVLFMYVIDEYGDSKPFDPALTWKLGVKWSCQQPPMLANRFLMGSGNERGSIAISLRSFEKLSGRDDGSCTLQANVFQVFPWYIKVYYHTLQVFVDHKQKTASYVVKKIKVSPSIDKMSPSVMEMMVELPCGVKAAAITLEYDKLSKSSWRLDFHGESSNNSPLLSKLKEETLVRCYTEVLLVPLTTPDFSMPYNVMLTSMVFL